MWRSTQRSASDTSQVCKIHQVKDTCTLENLPTLLACPARLLGPFPKHTEAVALEHALRTVESSHACRELTCSHAESAQCKFQNADRIKIQHAILTQNVTLTHTIKAWNFRVALCKLIQFCDSTGCQSWQPGSLFVCSWTICRSCLK